MKTDHNLHLILLNHVIRGYLQQMPQETVTIPLANFVSDFSTVLAHYQQVFNHSPNTDTIDLSYLEGLFNASALKNVVAIDSQDGAVLLQASPERLRSAMSDSIIESTLQYGSILLEELNKLKDEYSLIANPSEPAVSAGSPAILEEHTSIGVHETERSHGPTSSSATTEESAAEEGTDQEMKPSEEKLPALEKTSDIAEVEGNNEGPFESKHTQEILETSGIEKEDSKRHNVTIEEAKEDPMPKDNLDNETIEDGKSPQQEHTRSMRSKAERRLSEKLQESMADLEDASEIGADKASPGPSELTEQESQTPKASTPVEQGTRKSKRNKDNLAPAVSRTSGGDSLKRSVSPQTSAQKRKRFQNIAINLVKSIEEHRFSSPFLSPVTAEDYKEVIRDPKDLKTILKKIKQKEESPYETVKDLERDIMLMFANCVMYNKSSTHLVQMAKEMKDDVRTTLKMFEDAESDLK